ncbi:MAG: hypothetical protein ACRDOK_26715 [Streptosporangiaceae bacterium]
MSPASGPASAVHLDAGEAADGVVLGERDPAGQLCQVGGPGQRVSVSLPDDPGRHSDQDVVRPAAARSGQAAADLDG